MGIGKLRPNSGGSFVIAGLSVFEFAMGGLQIVKNNTANALVAVAAGIALAIVYGSNQAARAWAARRPSLEEIAHRVNNLPAEEREAHLRERGIDRY